MSEEYKIHEDGLYFVSFSVVDWLDVFTRRIYQEILQDSIEYCQINKNLKIYCYCIMPNHVHFIALSQSGSLTAILRALKSFTAKKIKKAISEIIRRVEGNYFFISFNFTEIKTKRLNCNFGNMTIIHFIYTAMPSMIDQKVNYIHQNPVEAGFVTQDYEWRMSSANPFSPIKIEEL